MSEWRKVKLGDLATKITIGTTPSNIGESFCNRGVPFIRSELITQNKYISDEGILYISNQTHEKLKRSQLEVNDILFSMAGVYLGKTAILRECDVPANTNQAVAIIRLDSALCSVDFVYYYLNKESVIRYVNQISGQAAQPNINLQQIGEIPIVLPSRKEQHRIAAILSRYDSLIENYQKHIKLLEEAAQRLYKEWFVDLHFPGHENTKIVDGVPEGWEKKKLVDMVDVQYGYAFDGKLFNSNGEGMPILRIRNIPDGITSDYTTEEAQDCYIVHNGDIVVGMDGIFHINSWSGGDAYLVQRACSFRPKEECMKGFIFQAIQEPIKFFEKTLVGATVAHLGKKHIDSIELCIPKNFELYQPFSKFYSQRQGVLSQIRLLTEARDRLLPKLMSGEIAV